MGGKVRQRTLLNLGRHFEVGAAHRPTLCARIVELLGGQSALLPVDCLDSVERHAQRIVARSIAHSKSASQAATPETALGGDVHRVSVDSMELVRPRTVGVEAATLCGCEPSRGSNSNSG